jgi:hemerythrin
MQRETSGTKARALAAVLDEGRRAVARRMAVLACAPDEEVAEAYNQLVATLEQAFDVEEMVLEVVNLRALRAHREQHARALCALHQACPRIESGDVALGREALELLARFLAMHRVSTDLALSAVLLPAGQVRNCKGARHARHRRHHRTLPRATA